MEAQIAQFTDFTGVPAEQAQYFLEAAGGNLELAMEIFLSQAEGGQMAMDEESDGAGESEGEDGSDYDDEDAEMPALLGADPPTPIDRRRSARGGVQSRPGRRPSGAAASSPRCARAAPDKHARCEDGDGSPGVVTCASRPAVACKRP